MDSMIVSARQPGVPKSVVCFFDEFRGFRFTPVSLQGKGALHPRNLTCLKKQTFLGSCMLVSQEIPVQ